MWIASAMGGSSWEFEQLGIAAPPITDRLQGLEETIQIIEGLWRNPTFTFHGRQFHVDGASAAPGPQQAHVPLMIAGGGERVTLRQVAQYGDVANMAASALAGNAFTLDDVRRKYDALKRHCEAVGRPYDAILRSYLNLTTILAPTHAQAEAKANTMPPPLRELFRTSTLIATPDEAIEHYRRLIAAGAQYFMTSLWGHDLETLRLLAEKVIPALNDADATAHPTAAASSPTRRSWWPFGGR
jgi:alkanesulfonate monooxygenase SsuD/methylene tetrahydromethanopterin reductase-like flavin-dependent oxidoreductase (luciferase family)